MYKWSTLCEKSLNMTNHQGNANQNHNKISSHTSQDGQYFKKQNNDNNKKPKTKNNPTNVDKDVEKRKLLVRMLIGTALTENNVEVPQ